MASSLCGGENHLMKKIKGISLFVKKNIQDINQLLRFPLIRISEKNGITVYRFEGINERINLVISEDEAEVWYTFTGENRDWLFDLSLIANINSEGKFFCSECKVPVYQSEADLYYDHFIKQLSSLIRRQFTKEILLVYYSTKNKGCFFTKLVKGSDLSLALNGTNTGKVFREFRIRKLNGKVMVYKEAGDFEILSIERVVL